MNEFADLAYFRTLTPGINLFCVCIDRVNLHVPSFCMCVRLYNTKH
jgi:hypothetical protein